MGVAAVYWCLTVLFNKTVITVNNQHLSIKRKPLKFLVLGDKSYSRDEVQQVYVTKYTDDLKSLQEQTQNSNSNRSLRKKLLKLRDLWVNTNNRNANREKEPKDSFFVGILLKSGKKIPLVEVYSSEAAQFIEQEIEHYMNIEDESVEGEWSEHNIFVE